MAVVHRENIGSASIVLWQITESEEDFSRLVSPDDISSAERFASSKRRLEHLAWRAALRILDPNAEISYNEYGAPCINDNNSDGKHIAVAHTVGLAVVIVSDQPCAVDTERIDRDFSKTQERFISDEELHLADASRPEFPVAVWCAKETLYKYSCRRELDFIKNLQIISSDLGNGKMTGRICKGDDIPLRSFFFGEHLIVYIV